MKKDHEVSSGNVFADLGLPNSGQELLKAKLTIQLFRLIKARGLTQTEAARLLGTTQAQVSAPDALPPRVRVRRPLDGVPDRSRSGHRSEGQAHEAGPDRKHVRCGAGVVVQAA